MIYATFMRAYPAYTAEAIDRLSYQRFWALCPNVADLAVVDRDSLVAQQRARVTSMRRWREERARRIAERAAT